MSDDDFIYRIVMTCQTVAILFVTVGLGYFVWRTGFFEQIMSTL